MLMLMLMLMASDLFELRIRESENPRIENRDTECFGPRPRPVAGTVRDGVSVS
jgi:hypothetical protein